MIQAANKTSVEMIHDFCNTVFTEKKCPENWGKAIIIPLHKKE